MGKRSGFAVFAAALLFIFVTAAAWAGPAVPSTKPGPGTRTVQKNAAGVRKYTVREGDSLYSIARSLGTSVAALKAVNQLRTSRLQIGQRLTVPAGRPAARKPVQIPDLPTLARSRALPAQNPATANPSVVDDSWTDESPPLEAPSLPEAALAAANGESQVDPATQPLRIQLASTGLEFLGVPYRISGMSELNGFDCSGFVKTLFDKFKINLPRSSREQYKIGERVDKDKLEIGDLIFFATRGKTPSHVGVYIGDNMFIHAARRARQVIVSSLASSWYAKRFLGARRLADLWTEEQPVESRSN